MSVFHHFLLTLKAPLLVGSPAGNPNTVRGMGYLPGSSIRGAFAALKEQLSEEQFFDLILSGSVRYLNAYPTVHASCGASDGAGSGASERTIPAPATWMRHRDRQDLARDVYGSSEPWNGLARSSWHFVDPVLLQVSDCELSVELHHSRDRKRGRATKTNGAVFTYESMPANTVLGGSVCISGTPDEAARRFKTLSALALQGLRFGRSHNVQYGGNAEFRWSHSERAREIDTGSTMRLIGRDIAAGERFACLLTADVVVRNPLTGALDSAAIGEYVSTRLGSRATCESVFGGDALAGGYNSTWALALPLARAAKAGAVVTLRAQERIAVDDLVVIEQLGLGERRAEGFGACIFVETTNPGASTFALTRDVQVLRQFAKPDRAMPNGLRTAQRQLLLSGISIRIDEEVADWIAQAKHVPSRSLLGRLRTPLLAGPSSFVDLRAWLGEDSRYALRERAMKQVATCELSARRSGTSESLTLKAWLLGALNVSAGSLLERLHQERSLGHTLIDDSDNARASVFAEFDQLARCMLIERLLHALARTNDAERASA